MILAAVPLLALLAVAEWAVDAQTDQQAIAQLRTAAEAGDAAQVAARAAGLPPEILDPVAERATCAGQAAAVKALVAAGARPRRFGPPGLTCLLRPSPVDATAEAQARWLAVMTPLLDAGVDPAQHLAAAARHCADAVAGELLARGADVNGVDGQGDSPLALSARCRGDLMERLLAKGATPRGTMVLYTLAAARLEPALLRARLAKLKAAGADVNQRSGQGTTPLASVCSWSGDLGAHLDDQQRAAAVEALLAAGADPRIADARGATPLLRAMSLGLQSCRPEVASHPGAEAACAEGRKVLESLLAAGADPLAADQHGDTPLRAAARTLCRPCLQLLQARGVGPDTPEKGGATLLHLVAAGDLGAGQPERIIELLLEVGARLDARDDHGRTPYDVLFGRPDRLEKVGHLLPPPGRPLGSAVARVTASSTLVEPGRPADFYAPARAVDGALATCWCEGAKDAGAGEWLQVDLTAPARIRALRLYPGCGADDKVFLANNRIQALDVTAGTRTVHVPVTPGRRFHDLGIRTNAPVTSVRLTIRRAGAEPGAERPRYDDTCIGELQAELE